MTKRFSTQAVHGSGRKWDTSDWTYSVSPPLFQTATFAVKDPTYAAQIIGRGGATYFKGEDYIYSRGGNPTQRDLEIALAKLEGAAGAIVFSSGMAAITALILSVLQQGDHVVCTKMVFGDTHFLLAHFMTKFGVETTFVDTADIGAVEKVLRPNTKLVLVETPANPKLIVTDLRKLSTTVHARYPECLVVVDNTFSTSYIQRPLALGCDAVVMSTTKLVNGHTDAVGGVLLGGEELLTKARLTLFATGAVMDPFAAWLTLRGLQTLPIRVEQQAKTAQQVFEFLLSHPQVKSVYYPGDQRNPSHHVAKKQMHTFGTMVAFELKGSFENAQDLIRNLRLFTFAVSLGSVESLISHPASMTHAIMTPQEREQAGISDTLLRLSIGLEAAEDLIADLNQALKPLSSPGSSRDR